MIFVPYYLGCLAHASYLVGDESTLTAVIVDPQRDVDQYVEDARSRGLVIRHVVLTHFHADFVAGHLELAARTGAKIWLGARAHAEFAHGSLADGDALELGSVRLVALETPGHTPEGICVLVFDLARDAQRPVSVLTGDTLFLGDVGRPDLLVSVGSTAEELAGQLYDSLRTKIAPLDDAVVVYPAHGAGSSCGKNISNERSGTLGSQRKTNWALQPMERAEFVRLATSELGTPPAYFAHAATLNRKVRPLLDDALARELRPLAVEDLLRARNAGKLVLDVREPDDFARAHLAGSINVGLSGKYASWCGVLLDRSKPIVLVAPRGKDREAAMRLARIGFENVEGFLDGGFDVIAGRTELQASFKRHDPASLRAAIEAPNAPLVLDVRAASERERARIDPSVHIPLEELERRSGELPRDRTLAIHCAGGYRSSIAASLLERAGFKRLEDLAGGMGAWEKAASAVR